MPKPRTGAEIALGRLRNVAWVHSIRRAYAFEAREDPAKIPFATLEKRLARERSKAFPAFDDGSRYLSRYLRGGRTPTVMLSSFEREFPGTREVFDNGPYGSFLWDAMRCRDSESARDLLNKIAGDFRAGTRIKHWITVLSIPATQDALVPHSIARRLNISGADLETASRAFARSLKQHPDLRYCLAAVAGTGAFSQHAEGALITLQPPVTYSPEERGQESLPVTAPVITGLSLVLLQARIRGSPNCQRLLLGRQREIEPHLSAFGLTLEDVARLTGYSFYDMSLIFKQMAPTDGDRTTILPRPTV